MTLPTQDQLSDLIYPMLAQPAKNAMACHVIMSEPDEATFISKAVAGLQREAANNDLYLGEITIWPRAYGGFIAWCWAYPNRGA